jgi:uncharacterized phage protein gp47/JayE
MTQINSTGFQMTRLDERFTQLVQALQIIFGSDINTDPNSIDGQWVGILAEAVNNCDSLAEAIYQSLDPDTAIGAALSRLVKLNGITRQPGSYSTVLLTLTGTDGTLIPAGSLVSSMDGSTTWQTLADAMIDGTGTVQVQAQCTVMGPSAAGIGTLTTISTPIYGWQTVTNPAVATLGAYEETDEELRIRRAVSTTTTAVGPVDAIRGALLNQVGVTQAMVYENNTDAADPVTGQPPHSIYAVVQGGADQDVWNVIWFKKPAGVNMVGAQVGQVIDTAGFSHDIKFDRPTLTPVYFTVNVKKRAGYPANGADLIKAAIVAFGQATFSIGQAVIQSEFYNSILQAINNTGSILSLGIGLAANPATTDDVAIAYNAIGVFDPAYILVVET